MGTIPPGIRITDLAHPILTPMQQASRDYMAQHPVQLSVPAVLSAAQQQTGLSDFGAEDFRERLTLWLRSVDEDRGLGEVGRLGILNDCIRYAANRLLLQDLLKRHPQIHDVEIDRST